MINKTEIRDIILKIFQSERENSKSEFDENYLFSYLTDPPKQPQTLKNSFKGSKKYYNFMDKIELEFGICFKLSDQDKYYTLDQLVETVVARIEKPKGNKIILTQRLKKSKNFHIEGTLVVILIALCCWIYWSTLIWLLIPVGISWIVIMIKLIKSRIYERKQLKKMVKRFELNKS